MKKILILIAALFIAPAHAASIIATVAGTPITDADVTARTKLMARQGNAPADNRRVALQNIIDDYIKTSYASNFDAVPDDKTVEQELKKMNMDGMSATELEMTRRALKADIAWQIVVARTILPTIETSSDEINAEKRALAAEHGLPLEMTIIRLIDIPASAADKLTKPKSCDDALKMAESLGGAPQKFTAMQYELSRDIRERVAGLPNLVWSPRIDDSVLLVCSSKKTAEYGKIDEIIKQNTMFKRAMFIADQQLKQLRRKAVIVINDDRYKL